MIRARKRFGQHFLERAWVDKVIRAIDPAPDQAFIEIGPGRGALTRPLAARAQSVVAYEIDRDLAAELRATTPPNVTIVEGDFLETSDFRLQTSDFRLQTSDFRIAANLPYNVASPILFKLVDLYRAGLRIVDATVMLQREVADRLVAEPKTKDYGVLTILIRHVAGVERLMNLPPGAFRPAPKVRSSVVRLRFHAPDPPVADERVFAGLVQAIFTRRRKTTANALLAFDRSAAIDPATALARADLDGRRRPETLTVAELARLAEVFSSA
jgi:16S rRNA (adenine1518-N6/adenine1519-N6)-dimethyltransferase